jgi:putative addiction module component (TIGR02574 family)
MPELLENVADAALSLPVEARIVLVDKLLASLNPVDREIDAAWGAVAERRLDDLRSGRVKGIPAEEVFAETRKRKHRL